MNPLKFTLLFILSVPTVFAQQAPVNKFSAIDQQALQIPDALTKTTDLIAGYITSRFATDTDKSRAIFIWIVSNIQYDVENMFVVQPYEKEEDKISKPLKTRKGICENYASLFTDICLKSGLKSFVVGGYTKQNGSVGRLPHLWSATRIDGSWFLFDPTWGAGYVNGGNFFKKINDEYYKVSPASLIKSHIPFDYLWQFLNYPITNQEFYDGETEQNKTKPFFNFTDTLQTYEKQSHLDQLISSAYRVEKNGIQNELVSERLRYLKLEIENNRKSKMANAYNSAVSDYNYGVKIFNDFIHYKNKQFTPKKTDAEIQRMLDAAVLKLKEAKVKLGTISDSETNTTNMVQQLTESIDDVSSHLTEQQDWLKIYFSKDEAERKAMFYKRKTTLVND